MSRPTRSTAGGRAYLALQVRARAEGRPTDELFVLYVLERFLYRLSVSDHRDRFVLKGGMLLAVFDERRPTADIDLLARAIANEVETVTDLVRAVLAVNVAEKVVTMIDRGETTTRDRDFADVYVLSARQRIEAAGFAAAIASTATHRGSDLRPIRDALGRLATLRQRDWARFVARSGLADAVPASLADVIDAVADFVDPILSGAVVDGEWDSGTRRWVPDG